MNKHMGEILAVISSIVTIALYLISVLFSGLQSYIMVGVGMKITYTLRKNISENVEHTSTIINVCSR